MLVKASIKEISDLHAFVYIASGVASGVFIGALTSQQKASPI